jgi:hypothetical protein
MAERITVFKLSIVPWNVTKGSNFHFKAFDVEIEPDKYIKGQFH